MVNTNFIEALDRSLWAVLEIAIAIEGGSTACRGLRHTTYHNN